MRLLPALSVVALSSAYTAAAQCSVELIVRDARDGVPLPGATVILKTSGTGDALGTQYSGPNGHVEFRNVEARPSYYAEVRFPGFAFSYATPSCSNGSQQPAEVRLHERRHVSLMQLISNPEHWDGKPVSVIGYLRLEFEGSALYLHKEDWDHGLTSNAIWVNIPADKYGKLCTADKRYMLIEGTFDGRRQGHMSLFSGEFRHHAM
jgi:hypothetical protein